MIRLFLTNRPMRNVCLNNTDKPMSKNKYGSLKGMRMRHINVSCETPVLLFT